MQLTLRLFVVILCFHQFAYFGVYGVVECETTPQSSKVAYTITVSQSGEGNFTTIKDAVNFIPSRNKQWVKILLKPGTYKEKVQIPQDKGCIVLEGSDRRTTTITSHDNFRSADHSVTFMVSSDNFVAKGVTFENTFNKDSKATILPAVAFGSNGDKHAFYSCGFVGYQDTVWDNKGRHYFSSCYIEGAADFIWGNGQSVYEKCAINVTGEGFITAQGRSSAKESSGYVFRGCKVKGTGHVYLGRAYRPYSRVIFIDSTFSNAIHPEGWFIWNQNGHEEDVTYAEVNCKGPGANMSKRVPWEKKLDSSEVKLFTTQAFIDQDGWIARVPDL